MTYPPQYPAQPQLPAPVNLQPPNHQFATPQYPTTGQQAQPMQQSAPAFQPVPTFVSAPNTSDFPRQGDLRGRLLLITPREIGHSPSQLNPGQTSEYVVSDVVVLDGGPVRSVDPKANGKVFDGHDFKGVWLSGVRVVNQLRGLVGGTDKVLGRINTQQGSGAPAKGNAWGVETNFTAQDADLATRYLNGDRSFVVMPGASHFQAPAAQQFAQAVQQHPAQQYNQAPPVQGPPAGWGQAPQQAPPAAQSQGPNPWDQGGQPLQPGTNPFAPQG